MELYLTVNADGVVSLWDTPAQAQGVKTETFITLGLTETQEEVIEIAKVLAKIKYRAHRVIVNG